MILAIYYHLYLKKKDRKKLMASVNVKISGSPANTSVALEGSTTVRRALQLANLEQYASSHTITRNSQNVSLDTYLRDGDFLILIPKVKGGSTTIHVRVMRTGVPPQQVPLPAGSTVSQAVAASRLDSSGCTTRLNGQDASGGETLNDGDSIVLVAKVHGGRQ